MINVEEMKKKRFQFLYKLYELSRGSEMKWSDTREINSTLGFDDQEVSNIAQYLKGEYLLEFKTMSGAIAISHWGIKEVEDALSNPDRPTTHFLPVNVISIGQMVNSQIQQDSPNATQVTNFDGKKIEALGELVSLLKESIDRLGLQKQEKSDLDAELRTLEAQMSSSKPKGSIISESLGSVKTILEAVTGNPLASALLPKVVALLTGS